MRTKGATGTTWEQLGAHIGHQRGHYGQQRDPLATTSGPSRTHQGATGSTPDKIATQATTVLHTGRHAEKQRATEDTRGTMRTCAPTRRYSATRRKTTPNTPKRDETWAMA